MVKKIVLVVSLVLALAGAAYYVVGNNTNTHTSDNIIDPLDPDSFKEGASGSIAIDFEMYDKFECPLDDTLATYTCTDKEGEYSSTLLLTGQRLDAFSAGIYTAEKDENGRPLINVTVEKCPDDVREFVVDYYCSYYAKVYEAAKGNASIDSELLELLERYASPEGREMVESEIPALICRVNSSSNFFAYKNVGLIVAIVAGLIAVICALSFKLKARTIVIGFVGVLVVSAGVAFFAFRKEIATVSSLKEYTTGVYYVKCTSDYKLDEALEANITSENELLDWASDEIYHGLPVSIKNTLFGCAAFAVTDNEGNHLMGRNTDYPEADCLMIYCDPEDGYDSIGMVDLGIVSMGNAEDQVQPLSAAGRFSTLAMPYMVVEGMNEAGFGVSILQLDFEDIHQDTGRKDVLLNVAVRAVLDKCATVDEAVALLDQYDMNTMLGATFHLFMTDKTGKSVVVEWLGDKMNVTENPAITNYIISDTSFYGEEEGDGRYEDLMADLNACSCVASSEEAMGFLENVGYDNKGVNNIGTEWSSVYDLDNFTVTICFDVKYHAPMKITRETFT